MSNHSPTLIALELKSEPEDFLINKVKELFSEGKRSIYLIHVVENIGNYGSSYGISAGIDIENILYKEAEEKLKKVAEQLGIDEAHLILKEGGTAAQVILEEAERIKSQLIIVGSHGHHGLRLLLGSTSNEVIHGAKCDVLAVRSTD